MKDVTINDIIDVCESKEELDIQSLEMKLIHMASW